MSFVKKIVQRQMILILIITIIVIIGGFYAGIPILSILYHIKLTDYKKEMLLLILGGGFYAVAQFIMIPIVVFRRQKDIAIVYVAVVTLATIMGRFLVRRCGIMGASMLYLIINMLLAGILFRDYVARIKNEDQKGTCE